MFMFVWEGALLYRVMSHTNARVESAGTGNMKILKIEVLFPKVCDK